MVGDVITYVAFDGGRRTVRVTAVFDDLKNGRPGFEGDTVTDRPEDSEFVWGYTDQVVR